MRSHEIDRDRAHLIALAADVLRRQGMPPDEIRSALVAGDPEMVRRHLELHRERLAEQLDAHLVELAQLERLLGVPGTAPRTLGRSPLP